LDGNIDSSGLQIQDLFEGYCQMPVLWKKELFGLQQFDVISNSKAIQNFPQVKPNKRLGKLAEDLFSTWLRNNARYQSVFENLQIIQRKQTLGELDAMLFDISKQTYIHLELITKFYLYNPVFNADDIRAWIGPNRNDSLYDKVAKLKQKQLPLLHKEFTQQILKKYISGKENIVQQVCFKANLFVPINFQEKLTVFNPECIVGNYLTCNEFKALHNNSNQYFCPTKQDWLRSPTTQKNWVSFDETCTRIQQFMSIEQSLMVWMKYKQQYKRYVVVPYEHF